MCKETSVSESDPSGLATIGISHFIRRLGFETTFLTITSLLVELIPLNQNRVQCCKHTMYQVSSPHLSFCSRYCVYVETSRMSKIMFRFSKAMQLKDTALYHINAYWLSHFCSVNKTNCVCTNTEKWNLTSCNSFSFTRIFWLSYSFSA